MKNVLPKTWTFLLTLCALLGSCFHLSAQQAYFIDGYHGGIYGHLPAWQTRFMVEKLSQYPDWKINLELEPESWDTIALHDKPAFDEFVKMFADQSSKGRIEYVNPSYAQSYLYNISGESIVRQFYYGMRKLYRHFPDAVFTTYSSEEPCFTSALPQILSSYGFKYASLKNPETCWGGYTRAFGGELVNWIGPDGSRLIAVPRYAVEELRPGSTWETIACNNSVAYIASAFQYGIQHPVGMCLQDAGWNYGPERTDHWIKPLNRAPVKIDSTGVPKAFLAGYGPPDGGATAHDGTAPAFNTPYRPTEFETWRGYIENKSIRIPDKDWHFSQEDVLVSLTWGGQILQRLARQVRVAENKIIATEKLAAMAALYKSAPWPATSLDEAWRTLLLSQHHDCWIVPYNKRYGITWADKAAAWTGNTVQRCDSIMEHAMSLLSTSSLLSSSSSSSSSSPGHLSSAKLRSGKTTIRVFNTTAGERNECVRIALPPGWKNATVYDSHHRVIPGQPVSPLFSTGENADDPAGGPTGTDWLIRVRAPSMGYATYTLEKRAIPEKPAKEGQRYKGSGSVNRPDDAAGISLQKDGTCKIETDLYHILIDPAKAGIIKSLVAKKEGHREFVDSKNPRSFDELRGNFYTNGGFRSSTESPAQIRILEKGPLQVKVEIKGQIAGNPFVKTLTMAQGQRRIDIHLSIDWKNNTGIGESPDSIRGHPLEKAFYNDSFKLQALFPLKLARQKVYKDAPYDVLQSKLGNTFFNSWDSIKNVVLLNWVDLAGETYNGSGVYGMALLSDHTTSYAHGTRYPLGLTIQYSGEGLFDRDYTLTGPTELNYAWIPHRGKWDQADIWTEATHWKEPLLAKVSDHQPDDLEERSMISIGPSDWEVAAMIVSGDKSSDLLVRLFNAEGNGGPHRIYFGYKTDSVNLVALNGDRIKKLDVKIDARGKSFVELSMPRFGIRTLQCINVR